jgi:hypothetical protein
MKTEVSRPLKASRPQIKLHASGKAGPASALLSASEHIDRSLLWRDLRGHGQLVFFARRFDAMGGSAEVARATVARLDSPGVAAQQGGQPDVFRVLQPLTRDKNLTGSR